MCCKTLNITSLCLEFDISCHGDLKIQNGDQQDCETSNFRLIPHTNIKCVAEGQNGIFVWISPVFHMALFPGSHRAIAPCAVWRQSCCLHRDRGGGGGGGMRGKYACVRSSYTSAHAQRHHGNKHLPTRAGIFIFILACLLLEGLPLCMTLCKSNQTISS